MIQPDPSSSAVDLEVLGGVDVRRNGASLRPLLAQPKRLALLAYVALRRADGVVSRDELLGVFWPESTEGRARASLRQALRFLRSHLGPDTLVNQGDAAIRIDLDAVACDAVRFRRAVAEDDDPGAVARYGGVLLPGFAVSGAHDFDRWLHGERQRLRTAAVQAGLRASDAAAERGDRAGAVDYARWALKQDPTDESVARRLISLLADDGNRAGAVAVFDALADRLAHDLDLEPSEETLRLIRAVRNEGAPEASDSSAGDPSAGDPSLSAGRPVSAQRILVLAPAPEGGDGRLGAVGRLAADTLARGLASIAELEVVPPLVAGQEVVEESGPGELARRTGAGTLVRGTLHLDGDDLHLGVRITDLIGRALLPAPEPVVGAASDPIPLIEELRDRTVTTLAPALTKRVLHVRKAVRPPSIPAFREYLDGLDAFVRGEWERALARFRKAVELEPRYALPRTVGAIALWNLGRLEEARIEAREATELEDTLGPFERAALSGVVAWLDGDWAAAHTAARIQADMVPGSIPHFQVAEEARRLHRPREAREVLALLEPEVGELRGWIYYWVELTMVHHLLGDHRRELEAARRCRHHHPDDPAAVLMEIRALAALGRVSELSEVLEESLATPAHREPTPGALFREAALELRAHAAGAAGSMDDAKDAVAREFLERSVAWYRERATGDPSEATRRELARALHLAGEREEARALLLELVRDDAGVQPLGYHHGQLQAHLDQGLLAVIAALDGDDDEVECWCRCLEDLDRPFLYGAPWFWLAAVSAVQGRKDEAVARLRRAGAEGMPHELFLHTDPYLLRLRDHEPFRRLMRPRG